MNRDILETISAAFDTVNQIISSVATSKKKNLKIFLFLHV